MKNWSLHLCYVAIILCLVLFMGQCQKGDISQNRVDTVRTETTLRFDTVIHLVHTHKIYYKAAANFDTSQNIEISPEEIYPGEPTAFTDTISDSSISGVYSGVLWQNRIFNPEFKYRLLTPVSVTTNTVLLPTAKTNKVLLGAFAGYSSTPFIGATLGFQNKADRILWGGYGYPETVIVGVQYPIRFKKK